LQILGEAIINVDDARVIEDVLGWAVEFLNRVLAQSYGESVDAKHRAGIFSHVGAAFLAEATRHLALWGNVIADVGFAMEGDVLRLESGSSNERSSATATAERAMAIEGDLWDSASFP